jgi:hypothetical protein
MTKLIGALLVCIVVCGSAYAGECTVNKDYKTTCTPVHADDVCMAKATEIVNAIDAVKSTHALDNNSDIEMSIT